MNLRGILVEYFITGSFALIWLGYWYGKCPFLTHLNFPHGDVLLSIIVVSVIYVTGMLVDFIGKEFTEWVEKLLRWRFPAITARQHAVNCSYADIASFNPELGKQIEMRSSRDRIARGAIINTLIITLSLVAEFRHEPGRWIGSAGLGLGLTILFTRVWFRFQKLTNNYMRDCELAMNNRKNSDAPPAS